MEPICVVGVVGDCKIVAVMKNRLQIIKILSNKIVKIFKILIDNNFNNNNN